MSDSGRKPSPITIKVIEHLLKSKKGLYASKLQSYNIKLGTASAILRRLEEKGFLYHENQGPKKHNRKVYFVKEGEEGSLLEYKASIQDDLSYKLWEKEAYDEKPRQVRIISKELKDCRDQTMNLKKRYKKHAVITLIILILLAAISWLIINLQGNQLKAKIISLVKTLENTEISRLYLSSQKEVDALSIVKQENWGNLKSLDFSGSNVSNIEILGDFNELERLDLSYTNINDGNIEVLKKLIKLEHIDLSSTQITTVIDTIRPLVNLKSICLLGTLVSEREIKELKDDLGIELECKRIRIGIITFIPEEREKDKDLDGNEQFIGEPAKDVAEVIVQAINNGTFPLIDEEPSANNSIFGPEGLKIDLFFRDEDAKDTKDTIDTYRELIEKQNVDIVIGYTFSDNCAEIAPWAEELGPQFNVLTILFGCGTIRIFEEKVIDPQYLFRTSGHATSDGVSIALYLDWLRNLDQLPNKELIIGGLNQLYAWGEDSWLAFQRSASAGELAGIESFTSTFIPKDIEDDKDNDYCLFVQSLINGEPKPNVIYSSFAGIYLKDLIEDIGKMGQEETACPNESFPKSIQLALTAGESILDELEHFPSGLEASIIFTGRGASPKLIDSELGAWLKKALKNQGRSETNYHGYRMAQALFGVKAAYEQAFKDKGRLPRIEDVRDALRGLKYETPSGIIDMSLSNGHQAIQDNFVAALEIKGGEAYKPEDIKNKVRVNKYCISPLVGMSSLEWLHSEEFTNCAKNGKCKIDGKFEVGVTCVEPID